MAIKNYAELIKNVQKNTKKKWVAVVAAHDEHTLEAVFQARENHISEPILIGDAGKINEILNHLHQNAADIEIIDIKDDKKAAYKGVELVRQGQVDFIMKGFIQTSELLKAVVDKEKGLRTDRVISHLAFMEIPNYHKLLVVTDGGMLMYPDLEQKRKIIENAVDVLLALRYEKPKVAALAAVENINSRMPETLDAVKLKKMNQTGEIANCVVEGPISYDLAMSKEIAEIKHYTSPVAGDADILLVPDIAAGNLMAKCMLCSAGSKMAGFITGAKVPVIVNSRGASSEEKYLSLALVAALV